jgi:hypothetical protein
MSRSLSLSSRVEHKICASVVVWKVPKRHRRNSKTALRVQPDPEMLELVVG